MNERILAIDDNPVNLKLASDLLELDGYAVMKAVDAEQALEMLEHFTPDLILLDIALPGMDGLALARLLKGQPRFRHVPIVALTAFAMKGDDRKALDAGCCGYVTKPIDTRQFGARVKAFLEQSQANRPRVKVMVIEDDAVDLKLAGAVLEMSGHTVLANPTAEAAAQAIHADRPDVILLDLQLPGADGLSFLKAIKSRDDTRDIPVVAVTAFPEDYPRDVLMAAGCAAYLAKPVSTRDLAQLLEAVAFGEPQQARR
jgi:two-component system cell cycle response regulator